jgi:hypothetical protein
MKKKKVNPFDVNDKRFSYSDIMNFLPKDTEAETYANGYFGYEEPSSHEEKAFVSGVEWVREQMAERLKNTGNIKCIVEFAPISERMWSKGDEASIRDGQIRLGGCWFNFDERYKVTFID